MPKLRPKADLFGQVLYSYLHGDKTPYAITRDDGWREFPEDPKVYFRSALDDVERKGLKYVKGLVLDVGCGAGRHGLYLQKRGMRVIGIDTDKYCVKTAKLRGMKTVFLENIFLPKKIRKYTFDTVWFGGNNLGIAGTVKRLPQLFHVLNTLTSDDAVILATGFEIEKTTTPEHLAYHKRNKERGIYPGQMKLRIEYKDTVGEWFPWLHVSSELLKETLRGTPWKLKKLMRSKKGYYLAAITKR
jgi:SAM-dependent methyltransferase